MEMFTVPISILAFIITLWITSFFATLMGGKKVDMIWISIAWLMGIILSVAILVGLSFIILDKTLNIILTYSIPLIIFTFVYRLVNKMDWAAAVTTNITAISVGVISTVIVIILLGKPLDKTIITIASDVGLMNASAMNNVAVFEVQDENYKEEMVLSDQNLLSPQVINALERNKKRQEQSYIEPKFQLISLRRANGAIGYKVRLSKNNGKVLEGLLSKIEGQQLIVKQTLQGGIATMPISMRMVKTLEVYR
jgi:hypothetical protein